MPAIWEIVSASLNLTGTIVLSMDPLFAGRRAAAAAGWKKLTGALVKKGRKPPAEVDKHGTPVPVGDQRTVGEAVQASNRALWGLALIGLGFLVQLISAFYKTG